MGLGLDDGHDQHELGQYAHCEVHGPRGVHLVRVRVGVRVGVRVRVRVRVSLRVRVRVGVGIRVGVRVRVRVRVRRGVHLALKVGEDARRVLALIVHAHADVLAVAVVVLLPVLETQVLVRVRVRVRGGRGSGDNVLGGWTMGFISASWRGAILKGRSSAGGERVAIRVVRQLGQGGSHLAEGAGEDRVWMAF